MDSPMTRLGRLFQAPTEPWPESCGERLGVERPCSDADRDRTLEEEPMCVPVDAATLDPVARELLYHIASVERAASEVLRCDASKDSRTARRRTIDLRHSILELLEVVDAYALALDEEAMSTTTA